MKTQVDIEHEARIHRALVHLANSINSSQYGVMADMSLLIEATDDLPLTHIDKWGSYLQEEFEWAMYASSPRKIARYGKWLKPREWLTWLDLGSFDGYKREKTLRTLSGAAPNAFFFALAVRRLNDWVPEVRAAAREVLPEMARHTPPQHIVAGLCGLLSHWHSWGRISDKERQIVWEFLADKNVISTFKSQLIQSSTGPLSTLFVQVGRTSYLDEYIIDIAETAIQPTLRAKAYRCLFERRVVWQAGTEWKWTDKYNGERKLMPVLSERSLTVHLDRLMLIKKAGDDSSSLVRRVAAEFLIRELDNLGDRALPFAEQFAADVSRTVSERGQFALRSM